ncbi:hypothetical protein Rhe02_58840 [Rhizocola hellebori]|uniref:Uncharacterized protein n=1 Tax=Rhizocola hellebori TaxID=1392758 RepID=A0A8J3QD44_9ACTN|nr:hypothetical protein Rhe02_58840 [Rhizocola hellebori]
MAIAAVLNTPQRTFAPFTIVDSTWAPPSPVKTNPAACQFPESIMKAFVALEGFAAHISLRGTVVVAHRNLPGGTKARAPTPKPLTRDAQQVINHLPISCLPRW